MYFIRTGFVDIYSSLLRNTHPEDTGPNGSGALPSFHDGGGHDRGGHDGGRDAAVGGVGSRTNGSGLGVGSRHGVASGQGSGSTAVGHMGNSNAVNTMRNSTGVNTPVEDELLDTLCEGECFGELSLLQVPSSTQLPV